MSTPANQPQIHEISEGDLIVVRFSGCESLDEYNADRVGELLSKSGAAHPSKHLVLDLDPIKFVTSTILGQFVALNKKLRSGGGKLGLRNLKPWLLTCRPV